MVNEDLLEAMKAAEKAFNDSLDSKGLDPAYFDVEIKGWVLDGYEFLPMERPMVFEAEFKNRVYRKKLENDMKEEDDEKSGY